MNKNQPLVRGSAVVTRVVPPGAVFRLAGPIRLVELESASQGPSRPPETIVAPAPLDLALGTPKMEGSR